MSAEKPVRKPDWLKIRMPGGRTYGEVKRTLRGLGLHTVCQEAACPNLGECWGEGTATFMILGDACTRGCRFCAVTRNAAPSHTADNEPERVASAARDMKLKHAVVTSVTRDDLPDGGAGIFAETVRALRRVEPNPPTVELLIPDYTGDALRTVLEASPDVCAHNLETVERLTPVLRHPRFSFAHSLECLREIKEYRKDILTKSSLMLGLNETEDEILSAMEALRTVNTDILVLGQYLRPARANIEVSTYLDESYFTYLAEKGRAMGFGYVAAHPLARTSHRAREALLAVKSAP